MESPKTHHTRHQLRVLAFQGLFQNDVRGQDCEDLITEYVAAQSLSSDNRQFVDRLIRITWLNRAEIDRRIAGVSDHWKLERITIVDRSVLRLAVAELLYLKEAPPRVIINEAIELAREYGTADSPQFVNALLDAMYKKEISEPLPPDSDDTQPVN